MCLSQELSRPLGCPQCVSSSSAIRNRMTEGQSLTPGSITLILILKSMHPESNPKPAAWQLLQSFSFKKISYKTTSLYIYKLITLPYPQLWCWQNPLKLNSDYLHFLSHPRVLCGFASRALKKPVTDTVFCSEADGNVSICCSETLLHSSSWELTLPNPWEHILLRAIPPLRTCVAHGV